MARSGLVVQQLERRQLLAVQLGESAQALVSPGDGWGAALLADGDWTESVDLVRYQSDGASRGITLNDNSWFANPLMRFHGDYRLPGAGPAGTVAPSIVDAQAFLVVPDGAGGTTSELIQWVKYVHGA